MANSPVCIVLMPYGQKPTHLPPGMDPQHVDFDRLWALALRPVVEELGYEAVRIDQEVGASVIRDMIERLTLCDLVLADLSLLHPNIFYEVGVRHAAKAKGCVLIGATWARWPSEAVELDHLLYPLPSGKVTPGEAQAIRRALHSPLIRYRERVSPCHKFTGFPVLEASHTIAFREYLKELARFQRRVIETRLVEDPSRRAKRAESLVKRFLDKDISPSVAMELLLLVRDCTTSGWKDQMRFIDGLPAALRALPAVQEQRALAVARLGEHEEAIDALKRLIDEHGDTAERRALLGARWKRRFYEAEQVREPGDRRAAREVRRYLDWAIQEYEKGMRLDLNHCECVASLPRLLRRRGDDGDEARAARIAQAAMLACERRQLAAPKDDWVRATLLAAAFDAADPQSARRYLAELRRDSPPAWILDNILKDLNGSLQLLPEGPAKPELQAILDSLRAYVRERRARRSVSREHPPESSKASS